MQLMNVTEINPIDIILPLKVEKYYDKTKTILRDDEQSLRYSSSKKTINIISIKVYDDKAPVA